MKKQSTSNELTGLIKQLTVIRKEHVAALAEIESTFRQFGIEKLLKQSGSSGAGGRGGAKRRAGAGAKTAAKSAGRKKRATAEAKASAGGKPAKRGPKKATKRVRGKFEITGDELILLFVRKLGCPTTEDIRRHWESEGRRGKAENNLTNLVKSGKLLRNRMAGQTRSTYTLPPST
jgi:hypothetical protein